MLNVRGYFWLYNIFRWFDLLKIKNFQLVNNDFLQEYVAGELFHLPDIVLKKMRLIVKYRDINTICFCKILSFGLSFRSHTITCSCVMLISNLRRRMYSYWCEWLYN